MKRLIFLLLILSIKLNAQTPFSLRAPLQQVYKTGSVNDTTIQKFSSDSAVWQTTKSRFKFNKQIHAPLVLMRNDTAASKAYVRSLIGVESDPIWVLAQPYYVNRNELADTARAIREDFPTGSTVYASDGVYKDGDTVKLSSDIRIKSGQHLYISPDNNTGGYIGADAYTGGSALIGYYDGTNSSHFRLDNKGIIINSHGVFGQSDLRLDSTGLYYTRFDTTLTTPTHLMTEEQTKREIAAAQRWTDISGGISYSNEVTVGSLAGTGNRNVGVDSNGKLIELTAGTSILQTASVTLTASQIYNREWVQIVAAQPSGKMTMINSFVIYFKYGTTAYTSNEFFIGISYDAGSTEILPINGENIVNILASTTDVVSHVNFNQMPMPPSNAALYIRNATSMVAPTGDGTLTITIYYTIIDI